MFIVKAYQPGKPEVSVNSWRKQGDAEDERDKRNARAEKEGARTRYVVREIK